MKNKLKEGIFNPKDFVKNTIDNHIYQIESINKDFIRLINEVQPGNVSFDYLFISMDVTWDDLINNYEVIK